MGKKQGAFVRVTWKTIAPLGIWLAICLVPVPLLRAVRGCHRRLDP
jgi:hypothetical protein